MKGELIRLIAEGNPKGRLKAIEFDQYGGVSRIEWHDDTPNPAPPIEWPDGDEVGHPTC
jgi:hypothetical protein